MTDLHASNSWPRVDSCNANSDSPEDSSFSPFISSPFSFLTRLGFPAAAAWSIRAHRSSPLAGEAAWARPQHAPVLETETGLGMAWISRKRWRMRPASTTRERRERGRFLRAVIGARRWILRWWLHRLCTRRGERRRSGWWKTCSRAGKGLTRSADGWFQCSPRALALVVPAPAPWPPPPMSSYARCRRNQPSRGRLGAERRAMRGGMIVHGAIRLSTGTVSRPSSSLASCSTMQSHWCNERETPDIS